MGSIYGVYHNNHKGNPYDEKVKGLKKWNQQYGILEKYYENSEICFGGCSDLLTKNSFSDGTFVKKDDVLGNIEAVIFNRAELITNYNLPNNLSDEELLLSIVLEYGYDKLVEINGDFAGAVYDQKKKELVLFRDHMGVRPLYYYYVGNEFVYSTDIRGIASMKEVDVSPSPIWLYTLWHGNYLSDRHMTEYEYIHCVYPGSYLKISCSSYKMKVQEHLYWELGRKKIHRKNFEAYKSEMAELIRDAVKRRADVIEGKIVSELSGGIDSSVVSLLLAELGKDVLFHSWSWSPDEIPYAENDERFNIKEVCDVVGRECHYSKEFGDINKSSVLAQKIKEMNFMDGRAKDNNPYVFPPHVNTVQITEASDFAVTNGAKAIFTGHGGDEGVSHRASAFEMFYDREYIHFWNYIWPLTKGKKLRVLRTISKCRNVVRRGYHDYNEPFCSWDMSEYLADAFEQSRDRKELKPYYFISNPKQYIYNSGSRGRLDNVVLQGSFSGVHYFVPFLDYRVIDYAVSIPRYLFFNGKVDRYIYREAFKDILPEKLYRHQMKEDTSNRNITKAIREKNTVQRAGRGITDDLMFNKIEELRAHGAGKFIDLDKICSLLSEKKLGDEEKRNISRYLYYTEFFYDMNELVRNCKYE